MKSDKKGISTTQICRLHKRTAVDGEIIHSADLEFSHSSKTVWMGNQGTDSEAKSSGLIS